MMKTNFELAFNYVMIYEVGPWFNPDDPETISGDCETKEQKRKVGFTNIAGDRGGVTKFGVAQNMSPGIDVKDLILKDAMSVIRTNYWDKAKCESILSPGVALCVFDMAVNNGVSAASKILQKCVGADVDGIIGRKTLELVNTCIAQDLINSICVARIEKYNAIVKNNQSQQKFLKGWLRRAEETRNYAISIM